ncbi:inorganic diphosphatase [Candidatus Micrarchaeota archaeon]|nr:inorganic diphosphatase [Candidatus Micrarchaeota archaeon]
MEKKGLFHTVYPGTGRFINVIVEIPMGSRNKYEYNKENDAIVLDRVLYSPFFYPVDYGFLPQSWYDDDDPLDVMVYTRYPTLPRCIVEARPIGLLRMKDEKGTDDKVLAVPTSDPQFNQVEKLTDLPSSLLDEISHFFKRYKDLEKGKYVEVVGWFGLDETTAAIKKSMEMYKEKFSD